jgi:hypothetical protein
LDDVGELSNVEIIILSKARCRSGQEDAKAGFNCHVSDPTAMAAKLGHNLFEIDIDIVFK